MPGLPPRRSRSFVPCNSRDESGIRGGWIYRLYAAVWGSRLYIMSPALMLRRAPGLW
jgi:hypothetical protein